MKKIYHRNIFSMNNATVTITSSYPSECSLYFHNVDFKNMNPSCFCTSFLTDWGRVTIYASVNVWSLVQIMASCLVSVPSFYLNQCWSIVNWMLGKEIQWNFNRNYTFSFKKMNFKILPGKCQPSCLSLNVLKWIFSTQSVTSLLSGSIFCWGI